MAIHPLQFKADKIDDDGRFVGFASVFDVVDHGGDIVRRGAFAKSLAEHARNGTPVVMLRSHNADEPIGTWEKITEGRKGLEVVGKLALGVVKARETHELLKAGAMTGLSIGYRVAQASRDQRTGARVLEEIELHEISLVALPMNPKARVVQVKADEIGNIREFETFLREAGWSKERAKILAKGFRPAADERREAGRDAVGEWARAIRASARAISAQRIQT
jgi:HK97 family phage prohead protease